MRTYVVTIEVPDTASNEAKAQASIAFERIVDQTLPLPVSVHCDVAVEDDEAGFGPADSPSDYDRRLLHAYDAGFAQGWDRRGEATDLLVRAGSSVINVGAGKSEAVSVLGFPGGGGRGTPRQDGNSAGQAVPTDGN